MATAGHVRALFDIYRIIESAEKPLNRSAPQAQAMQKVLEILKREDARRRAKTGREKRQRDKARQDQVAQLSQGPTPKTGTALIRHQEVPTKSGKFVIRTAVCTLCGDKFKSTWSNAAEESIRSVLLEREAMLKSGTSMQWQRAPPQRR